LASIDIITHGKRLATATIAFLALP
jgi:hypothetical protein